MSVNSNNESIVTVPAQPVLVSLIDLASGTPVQLLAGDASLSTNPVLTFDANIGEVFKLYDNAMQIGSVVVDASPMSWTLPVLPAGAHNLSMYGVNSQGMMGVPLNLTGLVAASATTTVQQIDSIAPVAPVILGLADHLGNLADHGNVSQDANPVLSFTATPGEV